jgi:hypothetical protein
MSRLASQRISHIPSDDLLKDPHIITLTQKGILIRENPEKSVSDTVEQDVTVPRRQLGKDYVDKDTIDTHPFHKRSQLPELAEKHRFQRFRIRHHHYIALTLIKLYGMKKTGSQPACSHLGVTIIMHITARPDDPAVGLIDWLAADRTILKEHMTRLNICIAGLYCFPSGG